MTPTPAASDCIEHTRRATHLRAYLEHYKAIGRDNLLDAGVTLGPPSPRVPWRYAASSHDGRGYWLDFDNDLARLALSLAHDVVAEVPWGPIEVLDLDTGQRLPVGVSVTVMHSEDETTLVQTPVVGCP